jgi:hemoglobin-like flavoprotein
VSLQISILEESFDLVVPRANELVERFYEHFFAMAPDLQRLFASSSMPCQHQMLLDALVQLRDSLRDLRGVMPSLRVLGTRYATYGARPKHYAYAGVALLHAMADVGGSEWRDAYTWAWAEAYQFVQDTMLSGASEPYPSAKTPALVVASTGAA